MYRLFRGLPLLGLGRLVAVLATISSLLLTTFLGCRPVGKRIGVGGGIIRLSMERSVGGGLRPFRGVVSTMSKLSTRSIFVLRTPFGPVPLFRMLGTGKFRCGTRRVSGGR